ncbi:phosphatidate cytidylyltransferase [Halonatronum saccharophilum]|uniref:phosphatidate cytidylyltransferase n=1 Tax=Halonatronum saccharophilum TaxID=150060 RepID=UPI00047F52D9|nr:phosphatidate cytidylyltransferase [Halonatronum saccharophilum]
MLVKRVLSAVVGIPLLIIIFRIGGLAFLLLNMGVVYLGIGEYFKFTEGKGVNANRFLAILLGLILLLLTYLNSSLEVIYHFLFMAVLIVQLKQVLISKDDSPILTTAITIFGVLYVGGLFSYLLRLFNLQHQRQFGSILLWLPILATWANDTGAYFTGMNFGKRPLAPKISPKKTIEGSLGGLAAGLLVTTAIITYLGFDYWHGIILGVLIGVFGQLGDLCESIFKRDAQIKDSGDIIPGHGGILDRIDSLLFALPIAYYYIQFIIFK